MDLQKMWIQRKDLGYITKLLLCLYVKQTIRDTVKMVQKEGKTGMVSPPEVASKWIYEYEDHTYNNQEIPNRIMSEVICKPGKHNWLYLIADEGPEVCKKCGLMRWKK